MKDLTILGGGPAGVAAGVYASRKQLNATLLTDGFGGQSTVSTDIQNWIGTTSISGTEWGKTLEDHLRAYAGDVVDIIDSDRAESIKRTDEYHFTVTSEKGEVLESKAVLIATGSHRRKLDIPGAEEFDNKGITYCASCDGPMFAGQDVVVVGGGNAGFESAAELLAYANSVTLLHHRDEYKADPITVEKVQKNEKFTGITNAEPVEVKGGKFVESVVYKDVESQETHELKVGGMFIEIGLIPNTGYASDVVELNELGQIVIDPWTQQATKDGVWAAGDCTNVLYHQNNIAAGDGVRALEDIYKRLF